MEKMQDLSIHVPCFNSEKTIERTVKSILNQSYRNFDLYIHDDCSTDNTLKILEKLNINKTFHILTNPSNLGLYGNFNNILNKVNSKYFAIFHSNDEYDKEIIKHEISFLKNNDVAAVFTDGVLEVGKNLSRIIPQKIFNQKNNIFNYDQTFNLVLRYFNFLACSSAMFDSSIIKSIGKFDEKYGMSIDLNMWFRLLEKKPIGIINKVLVKADLENSSSMNEFKKTSLNDFFLVIDSIIEKKYQNKLTKYQNTNYKILKMRDYCRVLYNFYNQDDTTKKKKTIKEIQPFFIIKNFFKSKKCLVILITYICILLNLNLNLKKIPDTILNLMFKRLS